MTDNTIQKIDNKDYSFKLAIMNSKLSNERTYMAYMRTGLAIAAIALPFKRFRLVAIGILMIIIGTIEYYYIIYILDQPNLLDYKEFRYFPFIITVFILLVLYMEIKDLKSIKFKF
jgi:uncharacterized membrane protein YidH (DUF202 family)